MRLISCKHPSRVYNKYIDKYIFVPCGQCSICRNRRAAKYTNLLERERSMHRYSFFVTLTYDEDNLPLLSFGDFGLRGDDWSNFLFYPSKPEDFGCIPFSQLFPPDKVDLYDEYDINYFKDYVLHGGVPYGSKRDAQLFLKRLNKYFHDHVTNSFKNFRYALVLEYGSTTFRPHFHAIFYCDRQELADKFSDGIFSCWKYGRCDVQPVENSACAYVAQYINKSMDLPYFYKTKQISTFFLCSRRPFIGALSRYSSTDAEIVNNTSVETFDFRAKGVQSVVNVPLESSYQNRLFPKCPLYSSVTNTLRIELYSAVGKFRSSSFKEFLEDVFYKVFIKPDYVNGYSELIDFLKLNLRLSDDYDCNVHNLYFDNVIDLLDAYSFNFIRRLYYVSLKVACQAKTFGLSVYTYIRKIIEYYSKRDAYLIKKMYEFQSEVSKEDSDSVALMYPEYLYNNGYDHGDSVDVASFIDDFDSAFGLNECKTADYYAFSNKKTHFKNAYLDSLALKQGYDFLYNLIKTFIYGKKCNEIIEAFATSSP